MKVYGMYVVEPEGSILNGGVVGSHVTEGIGMEFLPGYMDLSYFDAIHTVKDEDAFTQLQSLISDLGGGKAGFAFGSGMAAFSSVMMLFSKGDHAKAS